MPVDRSRLIYYFSKMTYLQVSCAITQKSDSGREYFTLASGVFLDKWAHQRFYITLNLHCTFWFFSWFWLHLISQIIESYHCERKWKWSRSLSHVWLFATPWTVAYQAPLSMGFSRQEYCSGLPFYYSLWVCFHVYISESHFFHL